MKKTTYSQATESLTLVLCNNIAQIEEDLLYSSDCDDLSLLARYYDNVCPDCNNEDLENLNDCCQAYQDETIDIFQYYLTNETESYINYLRRRFGLLFSYSEKLDLWVLLVNHCGTPWNSVECQDNEE